MTHNYLVEEVFKGVDNTAKRLFNHRPYTEGEIRSFVSNFEDKICIEKLSENFENSSERLKDINQNVFPKLQTNSIHNYQNLIERVSKINKSMNDVLLIESQKVEERKIKTDLFIREENEKLVKYMQNMEKKMDAIVAEYNSKRETIEKEYAAKAY